MTIEIDPDRADRSTMYRALSTTVVPRPIGWISTRDGDGTDNLAPFSFFNVACLEPPLVSFSPSAWSDGTEKDTLQNVLETGEFVHNMVAESLGFEMHQSSSRLPPDESEFDAFDIRRAESTVVGPPRVAEAEISFECSLYESHDLGTHTLVLGEIESIHMADPITTDGKPDINKLEAVGRLTAGKYTTTEPHTEYERMFHLPFLDEE